jgi:hypothetical protein
MVQIACSMTMIAVQACRFFVGLELRKDVQDDIGFMFRLVNAHSHLVGVGNEERGELLSENNQNLHRSMRVAT